MDRKFTALPLVALAGALLSFAVVPLVGWSSALPAPAGLAGWFRSAASAELFALAWDFAVVGLLGAGVAVFAASLLALHTARLPRPVTLAAFVAGFFVGGHVLRPLLLGQAQDITLLLFGRAWWGYGVELAVLAAAGAAALAHWRFSRGRAGR